MGLWNNPNIYGMLIGAGVVLAIGLLASNLQLKIKNSKLAWFLCLAVGMMVVGLFFSYSRGAWVGTAVGLSYLAKAYGKFNWWYLKLFLFSAFGFLLLVVCLFWHTPHTAPWYFQRLDLSRGSVQHRVAAWKAGFEMMRDHPLGVGWNKAVETYQNNYSPPENGAAALTMNSYLMLGTQLGIPALICFLAYVALALKGDRRWKFGVRKKFPHLTLPHPQPLSNPIREGSISPPAAGSGEGIIMSPVTYHSSLRTACRAGAIMLLVAFWFDGGLFTLATASVFWILLELSQVRSAECGVRSSEVEKSAIGNQKSEMEQSLVPPSQSYGETSTSVATT